MATIGFTERVKKIITHIAKEEAVRLGHDYVGTEHILLALIQEGSGVAVETIQQLNVSLEALKTEVERLAKGATGNVTLGEIRYTPRAHKVIDYTREEAQLMGHTYVGIEHLLLGLIHEGEGIAARALDNLGIRLELARSKVLELLSQNKEKKTKLLTKIHFKVNDDIELRMLDQSYSKKLFSLIEGNRSYLRQWLPWLDKNKTIEDTYGFRKKSLENFEKDLGLSLWIFYKGVLAGVIAFNTLDWENHNASIGYWLSELYQGKGIMTESCRTLIDYAFKELQLNRMEIRCAEGNKKSRAIPERLGFKQEGILREGEWLYDHYVDLVVYGLLSSEWSILK